MIYLRKGRKDVLEMKKSLICSVLWMMILVGCSQTNMEQKKEESPVDDVPTQHCVSMAFTGDLLFEQGLYDAWENYQFGAYFDRVKPYLQADLVVGNQEVPIGGEELGVSGVAYTFNAPKQIADQLTDVGFNIMTLSNNHSYDMGYQGVVNTLHNLKNNRIETVGMYETKEEAEQIKVIEKNGIKIAFLAYTYDTNEYIPPEYEYVVKTFLNEQHEFDDAHKEMIRQEVEIAKQEADVVIAAMHWGTEFTYGINSNQIDATNYLNELGVDLIIGNHPHCLQTMEEVTNEHNDNKTIVFYSLGNFVSSAAMVDRASIEFANMYEVGAIVNLNIIKDIKTNKIHIEQMELTPIVNHFEHGYTNFSLIPFKEYNETLASKHYQREFSNDFNYEWLKSQIHQLFEGKITINE